MNPPAGWRNPITETPGRVQKGVDAAQLLASRTDLDPSRLARQRALIQAGTPRLTPIQATTDGVIWDGHHAVRAAAERGETVDVLVVAALVPPTGLTILQLPVR
jgi:hypothetical protein